MMIIIIMIIIIIIMIIIIIKLLISFSAFLFDSRNFKTIEKQYLMTKPMQVFSKFLFL